jgi:cAMP-dependent protein kinase regulator
VFRTHLFSLTREPRIEDGEMFGRFQDEARSSGADAAVAAVVGRLIARKRYSRAAAALRLEIARSPDSVQLRLRLVEVLLLEDRSGEALSVLQTLADELAAAGAVDKATAVVRKILRIVPAHPLYRERLDELLDRPPAAAEPPRRQRPRPVVSGGWTTAELRTLQRAPLFAGVTRRALSRLAGEVPVRTFEPGAAIVVEGEPGDSLWVVAAGGVRVEVANAVSGRAPVRSLGPGDHFGEISILTRQPRTATVVAATASRLLELDAVRLESLARRHPKVVAALRRSCRRRALCPEEVAARGGIDALL